MLNKLFYCGKYETSPPAMPQTWARFKAKLGSITTPNLQQATMASSEALKILFQEGLHGEDHIGPVTYTPRVPITDHKALTAASEILSLVSRAAKFSNETQIKEYFQKTISKDSLRKQQFGEGTLEIANETYNIDYNFFGDENGNLSVDFSQPNTDSDLSLRLWFKIRYEGDRFVLEPGEISFVNKQEANKPAQLYSLQSNVPTSLKEANSEERTLPNQDDEQNDWNFQVIEDDPRLYTD